MNADTQCPNPLVDHRVEAPQPPGVWPRTRTVTLHECPDPECSAVPEDHAAGIPCRWSWKYAHGKKYGGQPFPKRRCPGCDHIRRAGMPEWSAVGDAV